MKKFIYLDNNATTFIDKTVIEAMKLDWNCLCANPSSIHFLGRKAKALIIKAKDEIASFLNVKSENLIFTSGGTEALNMTIKGSFLKNPYGHIITTDIEHAAVYNTIKFLENQGIEATFLKTVHLGAISADQIKEAIKSTTKLIVISAVNSETGVKNNLDQIAKIAQENSIPLIVDGIALLGKELFSIPDGVSAMCFSGHKLHGPKGIGLAFIKKGFIIDPLITGGNQENNLRAGTENLAGILGFAAAIKEVKKYLPKATNKMLKLRDYFEKKLIDKLSNVYINGKTDRICNVSNIAFADVDGDLLLMKLDQKGICVSKGSACSANAITTSRVLLNMGIDPQLARSSIRFSLSRYTTLKEIEDCIEALVQIVSALRKF